MACLTAAAQLHPENSQTFNSDNCQLETLGEGVQLLRRLDGCGGDSCAARAWVLHEGQAAYPLRDAEAVGTVVWSESLDELITEELQADGAGGYTARLFKHDFESHRDPYLGCISPSITPDGAWLWCRKLDGSVWKATLKPDPRDYQKVYQLQLVTRYQGDKPLYVVPYAYIVPAAVEFAANGEAKVPFGTTEGVVYQNTRWREAGP